MQVSQVLDGRYRLEDRLGAGGMSVVWRAHDQVLNRPVAVKVLDGPQAATPQARQRIRAEAQAAAGIWHPHVTNVYDYGESVDEAGEPVPYVVMELLPGRTFAQRLAAGPIQPRVALRICSEVAAALAAAHARGLVHRDVKPGNVMLTPSGAKVFDFGIAAVVGEAELELDGRVLGTPAYLAPERLIDNTVVPASDVYALGLLIYRALTSQLPWEAETTTQMVAAHMYVEPALLPTTDGVPPEVNDVCNRCLTKDPGSRPSAADVAEVLARAAGVVTGPSDDDAGQPTEQLAVDTAALSADAPAGADAAPAFAAAEAAGGLPRRIPRSDHARAVDRSPASDPRIDADAADALARYRASAVRPGVDATSGDGAAGGEGAVGEAAANGDGAARRRRTAILVMATLMALFAVVAAAAALTRPAHRAGASGATPAATPGGEQVVLPGAGTTPTTAGGTGSAPTPTPAAAPPLAGNGSAPQGSGQPSLPADGASASVPPGPPPPGSPPPSPAPGTSAYATVVSVGGTVDVSCNGLNAQILDAAPATGYTVSDYHPGPAPQAKLTFNKPGHKSDITVHCAGGQPVSSVKETGK